MAGHFPLFYSKAKIQTVHGVPNDAGGTLEEERGRAKLSRSLRLSPPSRGSGSAALFCNSLKVPGAPPATGRRDTRREDVRIEMIGSRGRHRPEGGGE